MYTIILSATMAEAAEHASAEGMSRGDWRWPARANSIANIRFVEVHELPSWAMRRDRHAIEAVLRRARVTDRVIVDPRVDDEPILDATSIEVATPKPEPAPALTDEDRERLKERAKSGSPTSIKVPAKSPVVPTLEQIGF